MIRRCMVFGAMLVLGVAAARQPVTSPLYYLTTAPALEDGVTVHGELTADDGRSFKDGSYVDVLVLRGAAGDEVEIEARSSAFDAFLTLYAPDGALLDVNDDDWNAGGTDAVIRTSLPTTGTYVVVVSGFSPHDLGAYTVTMHQGPAVGRGGAAEVPGRLTGEISVGGRAIYQVTLDEPTVLGAELRSTDFDTYLEVQTVEGWTVAENDDVANATDSALVVRLDTGTYLVVVSSYAGWGGGTFELELSRYLRAD